MKRGGDDAALPIGACPDVQELDTMRVGFVSLYSWRPHVEHLFYLSGIVAQAGHEVRFLSCDADLPTCYIRELRPHRPALVECAMCRLGGVRSYTNNGVSSLASLLGAGPEPPSSADQWGASSASTIGRFESDEDYRSAEFEALRDRLNAPAKLGYEAARTWIARERLDAIVLFNGRMDATRGILEAALDAGVRSITMERTWFGDGLQLYPDENCIGLRSANLLVGEWANAPLTRKQAIRAARLVAARFTRTNTKEWRAYNVSASFKDWPIGNAKRRLLLLPGSRNEIWGIPGWEDEWPSRPDSYDALIAHLGLSPNDVVLRAHPNWGERIGQRTGEKSERFYRDWAESRGVHMIPSADKTSTLGLIEQADAIVVAGGSAALEAAAIGKRVIALSPSNYQAAGFEDSAYSAEQLKSLPLIDDEPNRPRARLIASRALRFCYTSAYRIPQYVQFVSCIEPTRYEYFEGADPQRVVDLIKSGRLEADDAERAEDTREEDEILDMIGERRWDDLLAAGDAQPSLRKLSVSRRPLFRPLDSLRARMPVGDR